MLASMSRFVARLAGRDLRATALAEAAERLGRPAPCDPQPVGDADLQDMPASVQRYLRFMGVVGRPRDVSFLAQFVGRFRRGRGGWMPCEAWQFNSARPVLRIYHMRLDLAGVVPMVGRDVYAAGHGSMKGKLAGVATVADGSGPEFDVGELVTFLNDALLLAPSMLLTDTTTWTAVDECSFDVGLTDAGRTVVGRVSIDDRGALVDFETTDRFCDLPDGLVRARWSTPVDGWTMVAGRRLPLHCGAVWHLDEGPLPYVDGAFTPGSVVYNCVPQ